MSPVYFVTQVQSTLRGSAPIARRKGFPAVFRAALVQTSAALRPFHSSFASAPRVGDTPPHCALLPPPSPGGVRHVGTCHAWHEKQKQKARSKGDEEDKEQQSTEYLSDRHRPHHLQPQGWRDSVGEALEGPTLRGWPISAQLLHR